MYENLNAPMPAYKEIKLYTGNGNRELAQKIADILHLELSGLKIEKFANGEIYCRFEESVRGDEVFIIQSITGSNVNDILMELLIAADAAKRASAASVTAGAMSSIASTSKANAHTVAAMAASHTLLRRRTRQLIFIVIILSISYGLWYAFRSRTSCSTSSIRPSRRKVRSIT